MLVVDASVIAPAVADGGRDGEVCRRAIAGQSLAAPDLLRVEVMSVVRRQLANGALSIAQAEAAIEDLVSMPISIFPSETLLRRCWDLRDNVTVYDACYVALAENLDCPLATSDRRLVNAPGSGCDFVVV